MPSKRLKFKVDAQSAGKRLDHFLVEQLHRTRSQIQKLIKAGLVQVNGEIPSVHRWLKTDDHITIAELKREKENTALPDLRIVAETAEYVVVNKQTGVLVHPAVGSRAPVLTLALIKKYPKIVSVGMAERPGIVHRLDRDVSGLLVVAKTPAMLSYLKEEFKARRVKKIYTALVHGEVEKPEGVINFVISRSRTKPGLMAARPHGQDGRAAETRFVVKRRFAHYTLLELELITGRTHQIRAHLKAYGHAIVGDALYGVKNEIEKLPRPFLQATYLGFFDMAGEWQEYTVPLDRELIKFLAGL